LLDSLVNETFIIATNKEKQMKPTSKPKLKVSEKDVINTSFAELLQSEDGKRKKARICVMQSGWNANDIYFSKSLIASLPDLIMEKPKLYMNHELYQPVGRGQQDWLGTFISAFAKEDPADGKMKCYADFEFTENPNTFWIYNEIKAHAEQVHFSTHLTGYLKEGKYEDRDGYAMETLASYKSTDCVGYGAAGGIAIKALNSVQEPIIEQEQEELNNEKPKGDPMEIKTLADVKSNVPEHLLNALVNEALQSQEVKSKLQKVEELTNSVTALNAKVTETEKQVTTLTNSLKEANDKLAAKETELANAKTELETMKAEKQKAEWTKQVDTEIVSSKLPESAVTDFFKNQLYALNKIEDVKSAIEDRKKIVGTKPLINSGAAPEKEGSKQENKIDLNDENLYNSIKA
jgi:phage shock protein A